MTATRRRFLLAACALAGSAAAPGREGAQIVVWRGAVMGGEAAIRLTGDGDAARDAVAAAQIEIARLEAIFSLGDPASALTLLNRDGALSPPPLDLVAALRLAEFWNAQSGGAFDARVQPLWRALAEGRDPKPARAALARPYGSDVFVANGRIALAEGVALTLNGLAPGLIADRVTALLKGRGFATLAVDAGELRLSGPRRPIVAPALGVTLMLGEAALSVSAPAALVLPDGSPHILTVGGARTAWAAVAAITRHAATADALSTAIAAAPDEAAGPLADLAGAAVIALGADGRRHSFGDLTLLREIGV